MRKDGAFVKLDRIRQIQKEITKCFPKEVELNRIILWTEMNIGLTQEKAEEYITKIIDANGWVLSEGKISSGN
jgi:hypothetical protein